MFRTIRVKVVRGQFMTVGKASMVAFARKAAFSLLLCVAYLLYRHQQFRLMKKEPTDTALLEASELPLSRVFNEQLIVSQRQRTLIESV